MSPDNDAAAVSLFLAVDPVTPGRGLVLALDAASLWYRSYFALPESMTSPDGVPVNAVRGFLDTIAALITRFRPTRLVICLDEDWRPAFRVALVPSYKAHRVAGYVAGKETGTNSAGEAGDPDPEEQPDTLTPQVPVIIAVLDALGIAVAGATGLEADDVLGSYAAQPGLHRGDAVVIVSGDRDLLQVVSEDPVPVGVFYVGRGLSKAELFTPTMVSERYGVPPERPGPGYAELALLRGDASDGLPGAKGIGEKGAAGLLARYGSVAAAVAAAGNPDSDMPKAMRAKLLAAADYLAAAAPVVAVVADAAVTVSGPDELPGTPCEPELVAELTARWGIGASVGRLLAAMAAAGATGVR